MLRRLILIICIMNMWVLQASAVDLFVATNGNDEWAGRLAKVNADKTDGPFATLERARDEIRAIKSEGLKEAVTVHIRGGIYRLDDTFKLNANDSGSGDAPIIYRSYQDEKVRLIGGREVNNFKPIPSEQMPERIEPSVRDKIVRADLKALGITEYGQMKRRGFGLPVVPAGLELFFQNKPMTLARWPNEGFTKIADMVGRSASSPMTAIGRNAGLTKRIFGCTVSGFGTGLTHMHPSNPPILRIP